MAESDESLTRLPGVGPKRAAALAEAGFHRPLDLLWHLPRAYEDRRRITSITAVEGPGKVQIEGRLGTLRVRRLRGRRVLVEGEVRDDSGSMPVVWFNQGYLADRLGGRHCLLHGEVSADRHGHLTLTHPQWELGEKGSAPSWRPVYPPVAGFGSRRLHGWIEWVLDSLDLEQELPERLPRSLRERRGLPTMAAAIRRIHRPGPELGEAELQSWESTARRRLVYGELYRLQLRLARRALARRRSPKPHRYKIDDELRAVARAALPFRLTGAQKRALRELARDLVAPSPMRRLLQGDVGSGKTVVAAMLLLIALESGLQAALLAPTEILAEQHFGTLRRLFRERYPVALFTSSRRGAALRQALRRGGVRLAVGTHALLEEAVAFERLGLVVIDEQHRFGVGQRCLMVEKGADVDALVMSATPIPRSLALTTYGDLDLVVLDELPPGRRPVETRVVPRVERAKAYRALERALARGEQGYVVFPLIDEPEDGTVAALTGWGEELEKRFSHVPLATVHGRLQATERERRVAAFRRGEVRLLLATTVIEVGVDVSAATAMIIESAERFGLAQLHQLRGRVGRGERPSWCRAIHGPLTEAGQQRLAVFARCSDGFEIAEEDLRLRGPGELLGSRQAGMARLRFADLSRDAEILLAAREDAVRSVAEENP